MNIRCGWSLLTALYLFLVCGPPSWAEEQPLACVKELTMPHFSGVMIRQVPTEVQVSVLIGADGKPQSIDLKPNDTPLRFELLDILAQEPPFRVIAGGVGSYSWCGTCTAVNRRTARCGMSNSIRPTRYSLSVALYCQS